MPDNNDELTECICGRKHISTKYWPDHRPVNWQPPTPPRGERIENGYDYLNIVKPDKIRHGRKPLWWIGAE